MSEAGDVASEWVGESRKKRVQRELDGVFRDDCAERRALGEARVAELNLASRLEAELTRGPPKLARFYDPE